MSGRPAGCSHFHRSRGYSANSANDSHGVHTLLHTGAVCTPTAEQLKINGRRYCILVSATTNRLSSQSLSPSRLYSHDILTARLFQLPQQKTIPKRPHRVRRCAPPFETRPVDCPASSPRRGDPLQGQTSQLTPPASSSFLSLSSTNHPPNDALDEIPTIALAVAPGAFGHRGPLGPVHTIYEQRANTHRENEREGEKGNRILRLLSGSFLPRDRIMTP